MVFVRARRIELIFVEAYDVYVAGFNCFDFFENLFCPEVTPTSFDDVRFESLVGWCVGVVFGILFVENFYGGSVLLECLLVDGVLQNRRFTVSFMAVY